MMVSRRKITVRSIIPRPADAPDGNTLNGEHHMPDMKSLGLIYAKGILFLLAGLLAATMLLVQNPTVTTALLLVVAVWSFARFYYFAFYVIERYVDPGYRFAGMWSFARYVLGRSRPVSRRHSSTHQQS